MSVLYEDDLLLWGHVLVCEHLDELRTMALYWRGVEAEIVRRGNLDDQELLPFIRRIVGYAESASIELSAVDAKHEELYHGAFEDPDS